MNKLLILATIILIGSGIFAVVTYLNYSQYVNSFGLNAQVSPLWLFPSNRHVKSIVKVESFNGVLQYVVPDATGTIALNLQPYTNSPQDKNFYFVMPKLADLSNAYIFRSGREPQQLTADVTGDLELGNRVRVELQSGWDKSNFERITTLFITKD